VTGRKL